MERNTFYFLIPSFDLQSVLIWREPQKFQLPVVRTPRTDDTPWVNSWCEETDDLVSECFEVFAIRIYARRCLWRNPGSTLGVEDVVIAAELVDPHAIPHGKNNLRWFTWADAIQARWTIGKPELDAVALVKHLRSEIQFKEVPINLAVWRRPGWFSEFFQHAVKIIQNQGFFVVNECSLQVKNVVTHGSFRVKVKKIRHTETDCLSLATEGQLTMLVSVYLPCALKPEILKAICSFVQPDIMLPVIAIDSTRNAVVQFEAVFDLDPDPTVIMERLASMHTNSIHSVNFLRKCGVPDRRLCLMSSSIRMIFQHHAFQLASSYMIQFLGNSVCIQSLCSSLASYAVPYTLVHGNVCTENVCVSSEMGGKAIFTNWIFCGISHPFFDYINITEEGLDTVDDKSATERYLRIWSTYESKDRLKNMIDIARPLAYLYKLFAVLEFFDEAEGDEQQELGQEAIRLIKSVLGAVPRALWLSCENNVQTVYDFIIRSPDEGSILTQVSSGRKHLPKTVIFNESTNVTSSWDQNLPELTSKLASELGFDDVLILRSARYAKANDVPGHTVLVTDCLHSWTVRGGHTEWVKLENLACLDWKPTSNVTNPNELFNKYESMVSNPTACVSPWYRDGFLRDVISWSESCLARNNLAFVGALRQKRHCSRSSLLVGDAVSLERPKSKPFKVFVKTVHPDSEEPKLCRFISTAFTNITPLVLGVNSSLNSFIQVDGGTFIPKETDTRLIAKKLAEFQKQSLDHLDRLKSLGAISVERDSAHGYIQAIFENPLLNSINNDGTVSELRRRISEISSLCVELFSSSLPRTLVHGDLHCGNICRHSEGSEPQFLDWGSAFIGHPFCDFAIFCTMGDLSKSDRLIAEEVYFSSWTNYGDRESLLRISKLCLIFYWVLNTYSILQNTRCGDSFHKESVTVSLNSSITFLKGSMDAFVLEYAANIA